MKRILITGKNSYVGTSVKKYLEQWPKQYKVDELDVKGDEWKKYDFSKYDVVYHVAGLAHINKIKRNKETREKYFSVNTELAENVAKKAKKDGVKHFIQMSSMSVYGDSAPIGKRKNITNNTTPAPANYYGESKLEADLRLKKLEDTKFKIAYIRPPMIYGKNSKGNYTTLRKIALRLPAFPKIKNERSMIYIDNFTAYIKEVIDGEKTGILTPSNPDNLSTSEIVRKIAKENNRKILIIPGFTWALWLLSFFTPLVNKAFGSMSYDKQIGNYQKFTTLQSIEEMEKK